MGLERIGEAELEATNITTFLFIYFFLERGEGREKKRERNVNVWLPLAHPLLGT